LCGCEYNGSCPGAIVRTMVAMGRHVCRQHDFVTTPLFNKQVRDNDDRFTVGNERRVSTVACVTHYNQCVQQTIGLRHQLNPVYAMQQISRPSVCIQHRTGVPLDLGLGLK